MSNGTTLNDIHAPHIHRTSAQSVLEDATRSLESNRQRLLIMAAITPRNINTGDGEQPWHEFIQREVAEILAEMRDDWWHEFCASYVLDNPGDVVDDYDCDEAV